MYQEWKTPEYQMSTQVNRQVQIVTDDADA